MSRGSYPELTDDTASLDGNVALRLEPGDTGSSGFRGLYQGYKQPWFSGRRSYNPLSWRSLRCLERAS
ncbi:unnamed protein product [Arctogadus glacialis]